MRRGQPDRLAALSKATRRGPVGVYILGRLEPFLTSLFEYFQNTFTHIVFISLLGPFSQNRWDYTPPAVPQWGNTPPYSPPWGTTPPCRAKIFFLPIFFLRSKKTHFVNHAHMEFISRLGPNFFFEIFSGTFFFWPYTPHAAPLGDYTPPM